MKRRFFLAAAASAGFGTASLQAAAQGNISRFVVGFPPGGVADAVARLTAERFGHDLGINFIVENKPGASTSLAAAYVKRASQDGTTLLFAPSTSLTLLALTKRKLPYDPEKDFSPVARLAVVPNAIAVRSDSPYKTLGDYVAAIKAAKVSPMVGVAALGGASHIALAGLSKELGVRFEAVPYQGGAPMTADLLGGHIPAASDASLVAMHKAGKVRMLAVSTPQRFPVTPDVPTFEELGLQSFRSFWYGIWAPAGTPANAIKPLEVAAAKMIGDPAINQRLLDLGVVPSLLVGQDFGRATTAERDVLRPIVVASGYTED